ncbi:MAG: tetratricopeptide repeat protein [Acidimicrobiales bacterium]
MALDVTDATFETDVLDRSTQVPVVVDLWAPWCGPCRTLGPIIEQVVDETQGRVALVKVNVDENPQIGAAFRVQSIPAVYALRDRQVVNGFIGAQPEQAVRQFVESVLPSETDDKVAALVAAGDEFSLRQALDLAPDDERAIVALAELLVRRSEPAATEEALTVLSRIPETAETRRVAALARIGADTQVESDGVEAKLDALLERVKDDDEARQEYLDVLELLGPDDPRTARYRRALTSRLF